ncbi:MAG: DUF4340 domain-containing protein [Piscirickettsiaceae bacterium]|nr:DUF4340 domain-containing protein [Piscirickettsiaceae bacterium]
MNKIKNLNSLTILAIVTLVMVILMLITIQRPSTTGDDDALLFPELLGGLKEVDTLHFKSSQDEFTLLKQGEDWFIPNRWSYPADFNLVKRALIDIAEAKILERKTQDPKNYELLGVEGAENGGSSIQITMANGEQVVASLLLGNERETGKSMGVRQFYVRRGNEERAWLAEGYLNINPLMLNWIKSDVINIARERIAQVNIIQPNGQTATIINTGKKDKFGTPTMLDKTVFKYELLGYDIAGSLFELRMEDVQPLTDFSRGKSEVVTAEFITFDGLKVITKTSFDDGMYYTTFSAETGESMVKTVPADIQQLNVLRTAEQVQQEIAMINTDLHEWVYRFGGFIATNMMRAEADIVTNAGYAIPMPADVTGFGS